MRHTHYSHNSAPSRLQRSELDTTLRSVWQDKPRPPRARIASPQPAPLQKVMRPHHTNSNIARSQNRPIPKRQTEHLTLWVKPLVKAELQRLAEREGVSVSKIGATFLERAMQANIDMQYSALLKPIIETTIRKEMSRIVSRLVWFMARIAFDVGFLRAIVKRLYRRMSGVSSEQLQSIVESSRKEARAHIIERTPQLAEIIQAVEKWFQGEEGT